MRYHVPTATEGNTIDAEYALEAPAARAGTGRACSRASLLSRTLLDDRKNAVTDGDVASAPLFLVVSLTLIVAPDAVFSGVTSDATSRSPPTFTNTYLVLFVSVCSGTPFPSSAFAIR